MSFGNNQRGFTYLELVIVIIIISTLLYFAIDRLLKLQVAAEQAAMQQTIGILQSALALTIAEHIARDDIPGLKKYVNTNPMALLAEVPVNYQGEQPQAQADFSLGNWYYHKERKVLIYQVLNPEYFTVNGTPANAAEFKIIPVYDDNNRNGRFDDRDTLKGLSLKAVAPYQWRNEPIVPEAYTQTSNQSQQDLTR